MSIRYTMFTLVIMNITEPAREGVFPSWARSLRRGPAGSFTSLNIILIGRVDICPILKIILKVRHEIEMSISVKIMQRIG